MKYRDLNIQTQREFPNNARTEGFGWLVRAGYVTRENELTPLGQYAINHLHGLANNPSFLSLLSLPTLGNDEETYFPISSGSIEVIHCPRADTLRAKNWRNFKKSPFQQKRISLLKKFSPPIATPSSHWPHS